MLALQESAAPIAGAAEGVIPKPLRQQDCGTIASGERPRDAARPTEGAPAPSRRAAISQVKGQTGRSDRRVALSFAGDRVLKQTPLNAVHRAAGARMVDFGGWDMPVNYGSQIDEHHAVRSDAGMFDVSHMRVVDLAGRRRARLPALRARQQRRQAEGRRARRSTRACCARTAACIDDLIVYFLREDFFRLVVNAGTADKDIAWLRELIAARAPRARAHAARRPRDDRRAGAERAREGLAGAPGQRSGERRAEAVHGARSTRRGELFIARTGYTGEDGFEIMVPADAVPARCGRRWPRPACDPAGSGARDTLRLEAGHEPLRPGHGRDDRRRSSRASRGRSISRARAISSARPRSSRDRRGSASSSGSLLIDKGGVLRAHQAVHTAHGDGEITSGTFSPTLDQSIALARLPARRRARRHRATSWSATRSSRRAS